MRPDNRKDMSDKLKDLVNDHDGMMTYDYIVNHVESCLDDLDTLVDNLLKADLTGQFLASSARFLSAVDKDAFHAHIGRLVEGAIMKDREHRYIGSLLEALWGEDYLQRANELNMTDDNFRRIFKRIYPQSAL